MLVSPLFRVQRLSLHIPLFLYAEEGDTARIEEAAVDVSRWEEQMREEESKRERWRVENVRRRHNYFPFIMNFLKILAQKGELLPLLDAAMEKRKPKDANSSDAPMDEQPAAP